MSITAYTKELLLALHQAKTKAERGAAIADFVNSVVELADLEDLLKDELTTQLYQDLRSKPGRPNKSLRRALDVHLLAVEDLRRQTEQKPTRSNRARTSWKRIRAFLTMKRKSAPGGCTNGREKLSLPPALMVAADISRARANWRSASAKARAPAASPGVRWRPVSVASSRKDVASSRLTTSRSRRFSREPR